MSLRPSRAVPDPWPEYLPGTWYGSRRTLAKKTCPPKGVPVVYSLWDVDYTILYIGSTDGAFNRLTSHTRDKPWVYYEARQCADRETAFWLEAREVWTYRPPLNRDIAVHGRGPRTPPMPRPDGVEHLLPVPEPTDPDFPDCGHLFPVVYCCDWFGPVATAHYRAELDLDFGDAFSSGYEP